MSVAVVLTDRAQPRMRQRAAIVRRCYCKLTVREQALVCRRLFSTARSSAWCRRWRGRGRIRSRRRRRGRGWWRTGHRARCRRAARRLRTGSRTGILIAVAAGECRTYRSSHQQRNQAHDVLLAMCQPNNGLTSTSHGQGKRPPRHALLIQDKHQDKQPYRTEDRFDASAGNQPSRLRRAAISTTCLPCVRAMRSWFNSRFGATSCCLYGCGALRDGDGLA